MTKETAPRKTWKNLGVRAVSAVVFALVCLMPLYFGGLPWTILVLILGPWLAWEWVRMTDQAPSIFSYLITILAVIFVIVYSYMGEIHFIFPTIITAAVLAFFERKRREGEARWAAFGVFYIALPCAAIIALRGGDAGMTDHGFKLMAYLLLVVIAADVGAYFGGSYFQGPKLAPKLSPKKTWSGLASGVLAGILMGAIVGSFLQMGPIISAIIALPIVLVSVFGDFLESGIKRRMNVKDAGDILPGHGGLLDRLDSLILVVIVTMLVSHLYPIWNLI